MRSGSRLPFDSHDLVNLGLRDPVQHDKTDAGKAMRATTKTAQTKITTQRSGCQQPLAPGGEGNASS